MRLRHDDVCLWWKDWHSCSCGFLEEEIRNEHIALQNPFIAAEFAPSSELINLVKEADINLNESLTCDLVIPGTFIMCGEGFGNEKQFCSEACYLKSKGKNYDGKQ